MLGKSSRKSNQTAVGKCQALPSTVLRCRSEYGLLLFCVISSGSPMSLSRCMGEIVVHSMSLCRVRYCGLYCHGGNCLWLACHLSQVAWSMHVVEGVFLHLSVLGSVLYLTEIVGALGLSTCSLEPCLFS